MLYTLETDRQTDRQTKDRQTDRQVGSQIIIVRAERRGGGRWAGDR